TAPYGWRGDSATLADRVRKTLAELHQHPPKKDEVRDLVAYLESLDPPAPAAVPPEHAEAVAYGRGLFEGRARCAPCHAGERLCDGEPHDVGTGGRFDTPSLRGVRHRSPLLHSGEAHGPEDVFRRFNSERRHGAAHELGPWELEGLMAYVITL